MIQGVAKLGVLRTGCCIIAIQRKRKDCIHPKPDQMGVGFMTMKTFFFLSLSFLGYVVPVHWASPPPQTSEFTLFPPPIYLVLSELGRDCLV